MFQIILKSNVWWGSINPPFHIIDQDVDVATLELEQQEMVSRRDGRRCWDFFKISWFDCQ